MPYKRSTPVKLLMALAGSAALAACGSASDISLRNSNYVGVTLKDGLLTGSYNPAGFDAKLVQNQIKGFCVDKVLAGYSEQRVESGLVAFSARCASGTSMTRAFIEIERLPSGNFSVEAIGS